MQIHSPSNNLKPATATLISAIALSVPLPTSCHLVRTSSEPKNWRSRDGKPIRSSLEFR